MIPNVCTKSKLATDFRILWLNSHGPEGTAWEKLLLWWSSSLFYMFSAVIVT